MSNDDELRQEELQVLESIYPDYILETTLNSVRLDIPVELDKHHRVVLSQDNGNSDPSSTTQEIEVSNLPSIFVDIHLCDGYPSSSPPVITSVHPTRSWLPKDLELAQLLRNAWQGEGILCTIVEMVRSGEFLDILGLVEDTCIR